MGHDGSFCFTLVHSPGSPKPTRQFGILKVKFSVNDRELQISRQTEVQNLVLLFVSCDPELVSLGLFLPSVKWQQ